MAGVGERGAGVGAGVDDSPGTLGPENPPVSGEISDSGPTSTMGGSSMKSVSRLEASGSTKELHPPGWGWEEPLGPAWDGTALAPPITGVSLGTDPLISCKIWATAACIAISDRLALCPALFVADAAVDTIAGVAVVVVVGGGGGGEIPVPFSAPACGFVPPTLTATSLGV